MAEAVSRVDDSNWPAEHFVRETVLPYHNINLQLKDFTIRIKLRTIHQVNREVLAQAKKLLTYQGIYFRLCLIT